VELQFTTENKTYGITIGAKKCVSFLKRLFDVQCKIKDTKFNLLHNTKHLCRSGVEAVPSAVAPEATPRVRKERQLCVSWNNSKAFVSGQPRGGS